MSLNQDKIEELYPGAGGLVYEPMLIWKLPSGKENMMSEVCENGEYFAQEKIDGALYQYVKGATAQGYLFGRTLSKVTGVLTEKGQNVPHILAALSLLPNKTVLIGEIYYDGGIAKNVVSIMGCLPEEAIKRQEERGFIKYYIHDILFYDGISLINTVAWDRYRILKAIFYKHGLDKFDFLRLADAVEENIELEVSRILNSGGEGMVLKKRDAVYSPSKRPAWSTIKFKQMDDVDLVCTRTIPATKEYTGKDIETWPYWELTYNDGTTKLDDTNHYREGGGWHPVSKPYYFGWHTAIGIGAYNKNNELVELGTVSSGLTDEDRAAMSQNSSAFVGKVVAIHAMSRDKIEKTLRHPVFKSWRDDKDPQDCKIEEIFS